MIDAASLFLGRKGKQMLAEIREYFRKKYGKEAYGVESLILALFTAFIAFFVFPNFVKPLIEGILEQAEKG